MKFVSVLCLLSALFQQGYASVSRAGSSNDGNGDDMKVCPGKKAGLYPHPVKCSLYVLCDVTGNVSVKACERHQNFQPEYKVCVWEKIYSCTEGLLINKTTYMLTLCKHKVPGIYGDPHTCTTYVICSREGAYHMKCRPPLRFNSATKKCDKPQNVQCKGNSTKKGTVKRIAERKSVTKPCKGKQPGNYADPRNCNGYIACTGFAAVQMKCPQGLWFNETLNKCDAPGKVLCKGAISVSSKFSCKGIRHGKYAVEGACQHYYLCTENDELLLKKCSKHRNFHPVYRNCVWTYVYSCDDPKFCSERRDGKYTNSNNCYGYYHCSGERTFPRNCDPGLRFNGNRCVDASQYICLKPTMVVV